MNKEIELLYKKLDAQDKIIDEQALEISQLKEQKKQAINYIKEHTNNAMFELRSDTGELEELLKLLGDGSNE